MGGDDKQEELRKMLEKIWEDSIRVRSGITLHIIGNEAREQVAVKGEKEFPWGPTLSVPTFFLNPCRARHDSSDGQEIL